MKMLENVLPFIRKCETISTDMERQLPHMVLTASSAHSLTGIKLNPKKEKLPNDWQSTYKEVEGLKKTRYPRVQGDNDDAGSQLETMGKVAHNVAMRLKDAEAKSSGDTTECWDKYVDIYK